MMTTDFDGEAGPCGERMAVRWRLVLKAYVEEKWTTPVCRLVVHPSLEASMGLLKRCEAGRHQSNSVNSGIAQITRTLCTSHKSKGIAGGDQILGLAALGAEQRVWQAAVHRNPEYTQPPLLPHVAASAPLRPAFLHTCMHASGPQLVVGVFFLALPLPARWALNSLQPFAAGGWAVRGVRGRRAGRIKSFGPLPCLPPCLPRSLSLLPCHVPRCPSLCSCCPHPLSLLAYPPAPVLAVLWKN